MATHARRLIKANGLENVVEVIQSSVEDVNLPEKVDIIISVRRRKLDPSLKASGFKNVNLMKSDMLSI